MGMKRLPSNWLNDPSDKEYISRSVGRGLGTIIAGSPAVQKLAALAEAPVGCAAGHVYKLAEIESVSKCSCGAKWTTIKNEKIEQQDEPEPTTYRRMVNGEEVATGGSLDGEALTTNPRKSRRPWTGTR